VNDKEVFWFLLGTTGSILVIPILILFGFLDLAFFFTLVPVLLLFFLLVEFFYIREKES